MSGTKARRKYSEELKRQIAAEYERGEGNYVELQQKYGIASFASVHKWVKLYGTGEFKLGSSQRKPYAKSQTEKVKKKIESEYVKRMREKFMQGIETGIMPEFDTDAERLVYALFENQYLKKSYWTWANRRAHLQIYGHQRISRIY